MHSKSDFRTRIACLYGSQPSSVLVCNQKSDLSTRIECLYGSQTSSVVLCVQYSVISTRITCLYGSQPSSVVYASKTATFGPELQVSMQNGVISIRITSLHGSPPLSVVLCMQNCDIRTRHARLQLSQTSSVALSTHNSVLNTSIKRLY